MTGPRRPGRAAARSARLGRVRQSPSSLLGLHPAPAARRFVSSGPDIIVACESIPALARTIAGMQGTLTARCPHGTTHRPAMLPCRANPYFLGSAGIEDLTGESCPSARAAVAADGDGGKAG